MMATTPMTTTTTTTTTTIAVATALESTNSTHDSITTIGLSDVFKGLSLNTLPQHLSNLLDEARLQQLSYEAFLHRVLSVELQGRQQRALERRVRAAHLPFPARLETFDFSFQPTVSERLVRELSGLAFLQTATNVVLLGPPGVGKTHLACALALRALEGGHTALFTTLRHLAIAVQTPGPKGGMAPLKAYIQPKLLPLREAQRFRLMVLHNAQLLTQQEDFEIFLLIGAANERKPIAH